LTSTPQNNTVSTKTSFLTREVHDQPYSSLINETVNSTSKKKRCKSASEWWKSRK